MGADPAKIILPVSREDFDWSFAHCVAKSTQISLRPKNSQEPVQGPTVFTDGSGKTGKAIVTWKDGSEWQVLEGHENGSAQLVELRAALANPAWVAPQPDTLAQAKASHGFFHQTAHTLQKQFQLTPTEARGIVESCDDCHALAPPLPAGVNPRGLKALELWQTDVTQIAEFGRLKYVHVTVDTFSSAMWASAHTGEKARDVIAHWRQAFAVLGIPSAVKTDNGPAYASQQVRQFLQLWGVSHKFGIPHSPTGQAIVERAHGILKRVLQKQKRGMQGETPHMRNLVTKQWEGPYDLIASGRGYACVSTDTGARWVPSRCVRPDLQPQRQNPANGQHGDPTSGDPDVYCSLGWERVRKRLLLSWENFERLFFWAREQGFFPRLEEALSWENWSPVGERLMDALLDSRFEDVGPLVLLWRRLDAVWQGSEIGSSRASLGDLSTPSVSGVASPLGWLGPPVRWLRASGRWTKPQRLLGARRSRFGRLAPPCAAGVVGWGEKSSLFAPSRHSEMNGIEPDSVTVHCPNCGVTFPLETTQTGSPGSDAPAPIPAPAQSAQPAGHAQAVGAAKGGAFVPVPSGPAPAGGQPAPSHMMGAVPAGRLRVMAPALLGGVPDSLVSSRGGVSPRAASPSALRPFPAPGEGSAALGLRSAPPAAPAAVPSADAADGNTGAPAGSAPPSPTAAGAGSAARQGAGVFSFTATADAAGGRPVTPRGCGSSPSTLWTLPACQVTVRPKDHGRFWNEVRDKAEEMCDSAHPRSLPDHGKGSFGSADAAGGVVSSGVSLSRSPGAAAIPGSTGRDPVGDTALPGCPQVFPVLRGVTHNTHQPVPYKILRDIRHAVAQHGLGSDEVMHMIRSFVDDLLTPSDICSVARVLFNPVQLGVFQDKWSALAARAVQKNATRGQQDPRRVVTIDMLMGTGNYVDPQGQAGYDPLVLEQCGTHCEPR
ncbi:hypothetical protein DV515_00017917 [Chloebia gouldiae]|uniref:RNA-directed DNA polymerase n=3 Tax=Chloebia gouldiae TaxID=44316 RepID=A0A3L8Q8X8_CHLGU|nr:hypothetical protein DV515_00017917 [Chloebia gouldiae]